MPAPHAPLWTSGENLPTTTRLSANVITEVCVIGAGIAGLSIARELLRDGLRVVVLEANAIGAGMTQHTTAHLASAVDDRLFEIERLHGEDGARVAAASNAAAIDRIEHHVRCDGIDCSFERLDGYLFLRPGDDETALVQELAAARRAGLAETEPLPSAPIGGFDTGPCLRFPRQGAIHPLRYLAGLARAVEREGGRIFTATRALRIDHGPPATVHTAGGLEVRAQVVVIATNHPVDDRAEIHAKQRSYTTHAVAMPVPRGSVTRALYWDTDEPYHYVRLAPHDPERDFDLLVVGGEDHPSAAAGDRAQRHGRLAAWAAERFPCDEPPLHAWSGEVIEPIDGIPLIGRSPGSPGQVFIATGDSGMGMTHGTVAGLLLSDLIAGRPSAWADLYDPSRPSLRPADSERRPAPITAGAPGAASSTRDHLAMLSIFRGGGLLRR